MLSLFVAFWLPFMVAALLGVTWGLLARRLWPERRWPRTVLVLGLLPAAAQALGWPWFLDDAISLAATSTGNTPQMVAVAQNQAAWFAWAVRLAVLAGLLLNICWLNHPHSWRQAAWGPLLLWGLLWLALGLTENIVLYDLMTDMNTAAALTFVLCLCASLGMLVFTRLVAPANPARTAALKQ